MWSRFNSDLENSSAKWNFSTSRNVAHPSAPRKAALLKCWPSGYDQLDELLSQSEVTREALHQMADKHEEENVARAGRTAMSSRWKKVWADFWGNKARTFLTIMTIMVGTFAVGFNSNLGMYMNESMDGDYLSANPSEAKVYASPLDDDMVKMARTVPGVDAVEGPVTVSGAVHPPKGKPIAIQFTALEDPKSADFEPAQACNGRN